MGAQCNRDAIVEMAREFRGCQVHVAQSVQGRRHCCEERQKGLCPTLFSSGMAQGVIAGS